MPSQHSLNGAAASLLEFDSSIPYEIFIRNLKLLRAGQVVVDFNIIIDSNKVIFYGPPDKDKSRTVRGKVRLEVAGKLHVKEIVITLAGEFHIINDDNSSTTPDEPHQGTLFSTCILLANKRTLPPGVHEFYFEFLLPGDLPESMNSDLILCEYFLKAELVSRGPEGLLSPTKNKLVDVVDLSVQRTALQSDEHIKQGLGATRYTGSVDKILDYEFLVPQIMKLDTDTFTFHARWDGLRVDNVKFWFVQTENFKPSNTDTTTTTTTTETTGDRPDRKIKVVSGPFCFDLPKKEPLKLQSRPMVFQLPITESLIRDYDLNNVEIRHKLIVSIQMANKNKELIPLSIPITIESVVEDMNTVPPTCHVNQNSKNNVALLHFANKVFTGNFLEDNNQKSSISSSYSSSSSSSFKRFIRAERRKNSTPSNGSTTKAESYEQSTFQIPRRTSSVIRSRRSSNNNNVNVINAQNSIGTIIESASEFDESSNENSNATTATYTNNTDNERNSHGSQQKGLTFVTNSGNVIAEKFNKFNGLINRNRSNSKRRVSRAPSSASTVRFAPGLIEIISTMRPDNGTNISNINTASLTT